MNIWVKGDRRYCISQCVGVNVPDTVRLMGTVTSRVTKKERRVARELRLKRPEYVPTAPHLGHFSVPPSRPFRPPLPPRPPLPLLPLLPLLWASSKRNSNSTRLYQHHRPIMASDDSRTEQQSEVPPTVVNQSSVSQSPIGGQSPPVATAHSLMAQSPMIESPPTPGTPSSRSGTRHKCPHCDQSFTRQHNLKSHLLTHSHERVRQEWIPW